MSPANSAARSTIPASIWVTTPAIAPTATPLTTTHAGEIVPERAALEREFKQWSTTLNTLYQTTVVNQLTAHATALDNAYQSAITTRFQELDASLDHAADRHIEAELLSLESRLETAYQTLQQEKEHEEDPEETVEKVRDEAETHSSLVKTHTSVA